MTANKAASDLNHVTSDLVQKYCEFQAQSHSPYHAVACLRQEFLAQGYRELALTDAWELKNGGRYLIPHPDGKALLACLLGSQSPQSTGFSLACAHTDSPVLRLRLNPWQQDENCVRLLTQVHGGIIARSWLDRPLMVAGVAYRICKQEDGSLMTEPGTLLPKLERSLVASQKPLAIIPDLAIHLDRDKNTVGELNFETMLSAICGISTNLAQARMDFWQALGLTSANVDGFDLCLTPYGGHTLVGLHDELIVGPRHDDLAMVFAIAQGLLAIAADHSVQKTAVAGFFDAEETGSLAASGAASAFMRDCLSKLVRSHPASKPELGCEGALSQSFLISADMAHAYHPSYAYKFDSSHRLRINAGLVIKENANDRYATSGQSATIFRALAQAAKVPIQHFVNRQDIGCGSTVGPILSANLNCPAVDVGAAMWAMHSTGEAMGCQDLVYAKQLMQSFFSC